MFSNTQHALHACTSAHAHCRDKLARKGADSILHRQTSLNIDCLSTDMFHILGWDEPRGVRPHNRERFSRSGSDLFEGFQDNGCGSFATDNALGIGIERSRASLQVAVNIGDRQITRVVHSGRVDSGSTRAGKHDAGRPSF